MSTTREKWLINSHVVIVISISLSFSLPALELKVNALHEIEDKISSTTSLDQKKIERLNTINEQLREEKSKLVDENR